MGTLVFPPEPTAPRVKHESAQITIPVHCEICTEMLGHAECLQGQFSNLWLLQSHDENSNINFIATGHYEGATLYSFSVIATLDPTLFRDITRTAVIIIQHLRMRPSNNNHAPF